MTYEAYIAMNRDDLLKKLKSVVPKKRLRHMIGVEKANFYNLLISIILIRN